MENLEQHFNKWTFSSEEINFIKNKDINNQLAIAIKLKFFEQHGYKLADISIVSDEVINCIADLLKIDSSSIMHYNWNNRTSRSHDDVIRTYLGFKIVEKSDLDNLKDLLFEQHMPFGIAYENIKEIAYKYLFNLKIEPFAETTMERLFKSWCSQFEEEFFTHWANVLTQTDKDSLDRLLQKSEDDVCIKVFTEPRALEIVQEYDTSKEYKISSTEENVRELVIFLQDEQLFCQVKAKAPIAITVKDIARDIFNKIIHLSQNNKIETETSEIQDKVIDTQVKNSIINFALKSGYINSEFTLNDLKYNYGKASLETITEGAKKLTKIKEINILSSSDIDKMPINLVKKYYQQVMNIFPSELLQIVGHKRHVMLLCFCYYRSVNLTDSLIDMLIQLVHKIEVRAKTKVMQEFWNNRKETYNKDKVLINLAEISINHPKGVIEDEIYPKVSKETLEAILKKPKGEAYYRARKYNQMRSSYAKHYRRMISVIFDNIEFGTNNEHEPILEAIELIKKYKDAPQAFYPLSSDIPQDKVIPKMYLNLIAEDDTTEHYLQLCDNEPSDNEIKKNHIYIYLKEQKSSLGKSLGRLLGLSSGQQSLDQALHYAAIGMKGIVRIEILSDKIASFTEIVNHLQKSPLQPLPSDKKKELLDFILRHGYVEPIKKINKISYEIGLLLSLQAKLRCKEIWIKSAAKYRNPEKDLPQDFDQNKKNYYHELNHPEDSAKFISKLKKKLNKALHILNKNITKNKKVTLTKKHRKSWIKVSPLKPQEEPENINELKQEIAEVWPSIDLLDILKEVELRVDLLSSFKTTASKEMISAEDLQYKLILAIFALATNTGLKRVGTSATNVSYNDLRYVLRRYITTDNLRSAIIKVINDNLRIRDKELFGDANISCACDSTKFSAWDQNMMTQWHVRYGGRGVIIYWHVDKKSLCVYSQLKTCSSSEIASMIEGVIHHSTEAIVDKSYVDSHGQSLVAFAFAYLLNFDLLPRLKLIGPEKLYLDVSTNNYDNIKPILTRAIDWNLITKYYDQLIKYTTALRLKTAEPEALLKRFTANTVKHPIYLALQELGRVIKTIFICRYLSSEELRQEIHEGLNVIERWNSVNDFIYYSRKSAISTNDHDMQEISALSLHLMQSCLVYMNTLMIQYILKLPHWQNRLTVEDKRALSPLMYAHVNPYGIFKLDMNKRMAI